MPNYTSEKQGNRPESTFKVPIAAVLPISVQTGTTVPTGYLICDGAAVLRTDFPLLFSVIGTTYGGGTLNGNGGSSGFGAGTAFNLPDWRGMFLRGLDNMGTAIGAAGRDNGVSRIIQSTGGNILYGPQSDMMQGHWHNLYTIAAGYYNDTSVEYPTPATTNFGPAARNMFDIGYGVPRATLETRPINSAVIYYIKAF